MPATSRHLEPVPEPEDEDAAAAEQLREMLISRREAAKKESIRVIIASWPAWVTDEDGHNIRDGDGQLVKGSLMLYFRRLNPETRDALRADYTTRTPVRRNGMMRYEESFDQVSWAVDWAYRSMLPWCRQRYFEDQRLWGDEPVGTGFEYFKRVLTESEIVTCIHAVNELEHGDNNVAELLGKDFETEDHPNR